MKKRVKTEPVRIRADQASRLREIEELLPGGTVSGAVQRAVDLWFIAEWPVYQEHHRQIIETLKRQAVSGVAS